MFLQLYSKMLTFYISMMNHVLKYYSSLLCYLNKVDLGYDRDCTCSRKSPTSSFVLTYHFRSKPPPFLRKNQVDRYMKEKSHLSKDITKIILSNSLFYFPKRNIGIQLIFFRIEIVLDRII